MILFIFGTAIDIFLILISLIPNKNKKVKSLSATHQSHMPAATAIAEVVGITVMEIDVPGVARTTGISRSGPKIRRRGIRKAGTINRGAVAGLFNN